MLDSLIHAMYSHQVAEAPKLLILKHFLCHVDMYIISLNILIYKST